MNNLTDAEQLKTYLRAAGLRPRDYLGQNFLVDEIALQEIVAAADLKPGDTAVEVGPGLGVLTRELAARAKRVVTIEKDAKLLPLLKKNLGPAANVEIFHQDALKFNLEKAVAGPYKVVANIPYYLTSHLFQYFLERGNRPQSMTLMVQKEVGERVVAKPGKLSVLAISVQLYAEPKIIAQVPKTSFWPVPKVDSVILRLTPNPAPDAQADLRQLFRVVKIGFAAKRKQLRNNLMSGLRISQDQARQLLRESGVEDLARAQDLSLAQWRKLSELAGAVLAKRG